MAAEGRLLPLPPSGRQSGWSAAEELADITGGGYPPAAGGDASPSPMKRTSSSSGSATRFGSATRAMSATSSEGRPPTPDPLLSDDSPAVVVSHADGRREVVGDPAARACSGRHTAAIPEDAELAEARPPTPEPVRDPASPAVVVSHADGRRQVKGERPDAAATTHEDVILEGDEEVPDLELLD